MLVLIFTTVLRLLAFNPRQRVRWEPAWNLLLWFRTHRELMPSKTPLNLLFGPPRHQQVGATEIVSHRPGTMATNEKCLVELSCHTSQRLKKKNGITIFHHSIN